MTLRRRDSLKLGLGGAAAALLPFERVGSASTTAKRMATSAVPRRFSLPFQRPAELESAGTAEITLFDGVAKRS